MIDKKKENMKEEKRQIELKDSPEESEIEL